MPCDKPATLSLLAQVEASLVALPRLKAGPASPPRIWPPRDIAVGSNRVVHHAHGRVYFYRIMSTQNWQASPLPEYARLAASATS